MRADLDCGAPGDELRLVSEDLLALTVFDLEWKVINVDKYPVNVLPGGQSL